MKTYIIFASSVFAGLVLSLLIWSENTQYEKFVITMLIANFFQTFWINLTKD